MGLRSLGLQAQPAVRMVDKCLAVAERAGHRNVALNFPAQVLAVVEWAVGARAALTSLFRPAAMPTGRHCHKIAALMQSSGSIVTCRSGKR